jgi:hypothetical protein
MKLAFMQLTMLILVIVSCAAAQTTISGSIRDDSGAVVSGAFVRATRVREIARDSLGRLISEGSYASVSAQADGNGTFTLANLIAGKYYVCGYASGAGYISNCEWVRTVPTIAIGNNAPSSSIALTLAKGTVVTISVADPQGLISPSPVTNFGKPPKHHFYPGVITAQGYYDAAHYSADSGTSHLYVVTIPKSVTVALFVDTDLTTTTAAGQSIPSRVPSSISVAGGPDNLTINLNVQ